MSDRKSLARLRSDERTWIVPARWWRRTEPWRGRGQCRVAVDSAAAQRVRELLYDSVDALRAVLADPASDPVIAARGLAVLESGIGEPVGSGVISALLLRMLPPPDRGDVADLLVEWYGLEFAAEALVHVSRVRLVRPDSAGEGGTDDGIGARLAGAAVRMNTDAATTATRPMARRLRAFLAVAPDDSYSRAIGVLTALRGDAYARRLLAYLAPSEAEWVDEAVAELGDGIDRHWTVAALFSAVATPAQAERVAAVAGHTVLARDPHVLYSVAAHLGPAAAASIAACVAQANDDMYHRAVQILADFPTDEAFDLLIDLLPDRRARTALRGAVTAFPERARRLLATAAHRGDDSGVACAALLGEQLGAPVDGPLDFRPWLDLTALPALAPADAMRLCTLLAGPEHDYVDALIAELDPADRAAFGIALFERWRAAGYPPSDDWVLTALARTGDDTTARTLAELLVTWDGPAGHSRAVTAIRVLTAIGTEAALTQLIRLTLILPPDELHAEAKRGVSAVADRIGLSADQLADRQVPTCGLESDGTLVLADGTRISLVGFVAQPKPGVGSLLRGTLARPTAERFTDLEREVEAVAAQQARRLEAAMVRGRTWYAAEHRTAFLEHPLLRHIARQLVWVVLDDDAHPANSFHLAADGTLRDHADRPLDLRTEKVVIAHPLHLGERLPYWAARFADDRIRQPFPQLDRTVHRLSAEEAAATSLARFADRMVATSALLRLEDSGWRRSPPADGGVQDYLFRPVGADLQVLIVLDDGIDAGDPLSIPEQGIASVELAAGPPRHWWHRCGDTRFEVLDPITASEILRDLEILVV
ncbi:DUF4132 domain-containing protein [Nocardia sp. NBC_01377]|uniref:DUF4132 domain-containing protein n=1 Tax=Nocardia sp. NBC_01377 TaxID=2903595 RepID=UPI00324BA79D